ncbi:MULTISPECIES: glycoside hydrolase family 130 protein [Sphingopyxis]|uniref:Glycosidase,-related protein n=1 Tax=Sphingopyxis granuli TaxID=267128 RepID=A0AA86L4L7_9SPHN|nr:MULTISPECIES: glycoside hydrolase family 130 protein [Sphingopyxis]AMG76131.1 Glycosidase,-related protein [Sphingopyxis granuli]ODU28267.1 MAG: glycosidase [Sphingopyxis sp. SCN 67-31]
MLICRPDQSPLHILDEKLNADPSRVVLRPFHLAWQASVSEPSRAAQLVSDILTLDDDQAEAELDIVWQDFSERHWQIGRIFDQRFAEIAEDVRLARASVSPVKQRLIGAYFCHEYSYAAAALMNPSVVPHPDQSGLSGGQQRFLMSLRAVGEGHISSIAFREGMIGPGGDFRLWPQSGPAMAAVVDDRHRMEADGAVTVHRQPDSAISNSVLFPVTEAQRNGLEDLRLVSFTHDDGRREYIGTYTAYSGRAIRSEMLRTTDFASFCLEPFTGRAARNKGMALFPRKIGGRYLMVGRQDGKNVTLLSSDSLTHWDDEGELLLSPEFPWEFVQMGNCGSPIECDEGWLLLTHGVGAMRKYSLGAALLDRDDPSRVIGRTACPILTAAESDREGYVPNVVYTCGAMRVGDELFIPYGISDSAIGFATASLDDLLDLLL